METLKNLVKSRDTKKKKHSGEKKEKKPSHYARLKALQNVHKQTHNSKLLFGETILAEFGMTSFTAMYVFYAIGWLLSSGLLWATVSVMIASLVGDFKSSDLTEETTITVNTVMGTTPIFLAAILIVAFLTYIADFMIASFHIVFYKNAGGVVYALNNSNFGGKSIFTIGFFTLTLAANIMVNNDSSPWYAFGLQLGATLFVIGCEQINALLWFWDRISCKDEDIRDANERLRQFTTHVVGPMEHIGFNLPPALAAVWSFIKTISYMYDANFAVGTYLGWGDNDGLYVLISMVFFFCYFGIIRVGIQFSILTAMSSCVVLLGIEIHQILNKTLYPMSWRVDMALLVFFFCGSFWAFFMAAWYSKKMLKKIKSQHCISSIAYKLAFHAENYWKFTTFAFMDKETMADIGLGDVSAIKNKKKAALEEAAREI